MNVSIIKKANDIVNSLSEGYVAVIDDKGFPNVATRSSIQPDGIYSCYFATGTEGDMAQSIMENDKASVCFRKENDNVTLVGKCEIVNDMDTKTKLWVDWFINHFPKGVEDPNFCLIRFETISVSLWIDHESSKFNIVDIKEAQSYCGLLCDGCSFKESHNCSRCIKTNGHPFYGECHIAICCQEKGYTHCGECPDMPCDALYEYAYGDSEHCDVPKGARLEMLKYWNKK